MIQVFIIEPISNTFTIGLANKERYVLTDSLSSFCVKSSHCIDQTIPAGATKDERGNKETSSNFIREIIYSLYYCYDAVSEYWMHTMLELSNKSARQTLHSNLSVPTGKEYTFGNTTDSTLERNISIVFDNRAYKEN